MGGIPTAEDCAIAAKVTEALAVERFGNEARIARVEVEPDDDPDDPTLRIRLVAETPGETQLNDDARMDFRLVLGSA